MSDPKLNPNENFIAVHESEGSTKIIKFIDAETFPKAAKLQEQSQLYGVYQNKFGQLVATDIWGNKYVLK